MTIAGLTDAAVAWCKDNERSVRQISSHARRKIVPTNKTNETPQSRFRLCQAASFAMASAMCLLCLVLVVLRTKLRSASKEPLVGTWQLGCCFTTRSGKRVRCCGASGGVMHHAKQTGVDSERCGPRPPRSCREAAAKLPRLRTLGTV